LGATVNKPPEFIASYWTLAGNVMPRAPSQVSPIPFEARAQAAARAGFRGIGLMHDDLRATVARLGLPTMKRILEDNGLVHLELEFLGDWFASGERRRASDLLRIQLLTAAEFLGARHIKVGADSSGEEWPIGRLAAEFFRLCEAAAQHGTSIALELLPWTQLATIDRALAVVKEADASNGGLLLDIWHLHRAGQDLDAIAEIPRRYLCAAELNDAGLAEGPLWEDTINRRKPCGQGVLDLAGFIDGLATAGFHGPYGIEIISTEHRLLPVDVAAKVALESATQQFLRGGPPRPGSP
jgi:sugar phosphate isomerase/epimerase